MKKRSIETQKFNYILLLICFMITSCVIDPPQKAIEIINNSDSTLYVAYSLTDSIDINNKLCLYEVEYYNDSRHLIKPNYRIEAHKKRSIGTTGREKLVNQAKDKKIRIFLITEKTMRERTWEDIVKRHLYETKKVLTVDQLNAIDWTLTYPK